MLDRRRLLVVERGTQQGCGQLSMCPVPGARRGQCSWSLAQLSRANYLRPQGQFTPHKILLGPTAGPCPWPTTPTAAHQFLLGIEVGAGGQPGRSRCCVAAQGVGRSGVKWSL